MQTVKYEKEGLELTNCGGFTFEKFWVIVQKCIKIADRKLFKGVDCQTTIIFPSEFEAISSDFWLNYITSIKKNFYILEILSAFAKRILREKDLAL